MKRKFMSVFSTGAIVAIVGSALSLSSCDTKTTNNGQHVPTTSDSLQIALANQDSLLVLMNDISEGMMQIKSIENILGSTSLSGESTSRREQLINDMHAIESALAERRQRLEELEKKLKSSNSNNAVLQRSIETLKEQIASQETTINDLRDELAKANIQIGELTQSVDSLSNTVTAVTVAKEQVEQANATLTNEINTVYYAIGSDKELKDAGVLKNGGFLRGAKINPDEFGANTFNKADRRNLKTIPLHSKKAKVMTQQPTDSYILEDDGTQKVLTITNPDRFWNQSPYLVIRID
ncbi:MAG: hypothetical protein K2H32_04685 [Muribaculaceae bacterium]|nr:hypothetical protein [Muribaculaceae bacterium]